MQKVGDEFIPTRQSLLSRLRDWDDRESWREFFDIYGGLIYRLARKAGLGDAEGQDVVQETLISVARQMPGFKYDPSIGSFKGWLRQLTRRRIVDQLRKRPPDAAESRLRSDSDVLDNVADGAGPDFDAVWEEEWRKQLLQAAVQKVKKRVHPRQYQMFDLYVTKQWPIKTVTDTLGVNVAQVYMAKMRISRMIREEVRLLQSQTA